jgi:hypothetical protein
LRFADRETAVAVAEKASAVEMAAAGLAVVATKRGCDGCGAGGGGGGGGGGKGSS